MTLQNFKVEFQKNNLIKRILLNDVQVNLLNLSNIDTPMLNIYIKKNDQVITLLSSSSQITVEKYTNQITYVGSNSDIEFKIDFKFIDNVIFIDVELSEELPIFFTTDVGLGNYNIGDGAMYASQYIDNHVFDDNTIAMRKTTKVDAGFPYGQFGSLNKIVSYATEGYDFFGLNYKFENDITSISKGHLPSRAKNYEFAFAALEVAPTTNSKFYMLIKENQSEAITNKVSTSDIEAKYNEFQVGQLIEKDAVILPKIELVNGEELSEGQVQSRYPEMVNIEESNDKLLSFFTKDHAHIVTQYKEILTERSHANIITTGNQEIKNDKTFVSTNYMNGVFAAQNAVGNTQQNMLNNNVKSLLFNNKLEGMRIMLHDEDNLRLLNVPSLFEMGFNYSKWIYQIDNNVIEVLAYTDLDNPQVSIEVNSQAPISFSLLESISDNFSLDQDVFTVKPNTFQSNHIPELNYKYTIDNGLRSQFKFDESISEISFIDTCHTKLIISGSKVKDNNVVDKKFEESVQDYKNYYDGLLGEMKLSIENEEKTNVDGLNQMLYWYVHNGLIHFASPHGVEQHGGAAWGTRDVCQGPVELFATLGKFDVVRSILIKLFDNQFIEDGNWPQWFMFDEYEDIRPYDSHGDIIVWPLKAIADYLRQTSDYSILEEVCGYYSYTQKRSEVKETIFEHVKREIDYITSNFLPDTFLSKYGEGDWDDTLQPANTDLRENMVSGWTVPLTYQAISTFAKATESIDSEYSEKLMKISEQIELDYRKVLIKDDVITGFIYKQPNGSIDYLLHPTDEATGIKYRLLPINRSIISELFSPKEVDNHLKIIDDNLACPDGIRLMDAPANYAGGVSKIFQRAETASTVGREISLQYIHAHIRYLEAMAKLGMADRMYQGLMVISPFTIHDNVKNANIRQSNSYYSSSEGDYDNRYDYAKNFDKLKTGNIEVKSGWRIYSSGPGILLNQIISNMFGFKYIENELVIDPVVSAKLDGLSISRKLEGKEFTINFSSKYTETRLNGSVITPNCQTSKYRTGGYRLKSNELKEKNILEIRI